MARLAKTLLLFTLLPSLAPAQVFDYAMEAEPTIVCQVLRLCDIALERREQITSVMLGDTVRWNVNQFKTGSGDNLVQHLSIKPLAVNLTTSLVIGTNRRAYHLILKSSASQNMTQVSFTYSDNLINLPEREEGAVPQRASERASRARSAALVELDTEYLVEGSSELTPEQVYNDGRHTYIKMPMRIRQYKMPALLSISQEGGLFSSERRENLNYRTHGTTYMLDTIPPHLVLLLDTGDEEKRVDIYHTKKF
ncbi:MAG: P-type conjugative transfer protein TrbG [Succinivibrio sp.]|nr:P-type conjugative transfer protein TrbG [Succinivibrio sp.]